MLEDLPPFTEDWGEQDGSDPLAGDWLVPFAQDVRFASRGPVPVPAPELAALFEAGVFQPGLFQAGLVQADGSRSSLSIDKGDLLVTAASNVHGPAPQAAGLPNWRKESTMPLAFFSTLLAKLTGAGTAAKAAIATLTALTTMTVAGAAAGVLPGPVQGAVGGAINAVSPLNVPTDNPGKTVDAATGIINDLLASVPTSIVAPPSISTDTNIDTSGGTSSVGATVNVPVPSIPPISIPNIPMPTLPDVGGIVGSLPIPVQLPPCVKSLIPAPGTLPDPTTLVAQIPACIQTVLATANLPVNVSSCVASVLGTVSGVLSPGAIGTLPKLDVSACVPLDTTACTSNVLAAIGASNAPFVGDMLKQIFGGSGLGSAQLGGGWGGFFAGLNLNVPGLNAIPAGCVPIDVSKCLTAVSGILSSLPPTGGVPSVNLSACMPTGLTSGIPGLGGGIPGLGGIPFFPFG